MLPTFINLLVSFLFYHVLAALIVLQTEIEIEIESHWREIRYQYSDWREGCLLTVVLQVVFLLLVARDEQALM